MMNNSDIQYSKDFIKQFEKAPLKIQKATKTKIEIYRNNPNHPLLKKYKLIGEYSDVWSINITGDWRGLFQENDADNIVLFIALGTHSQLYE